MVFLSSFSLSLNLNFEWFIKIMCLRDAHHELCQDEFAWIYGWKLVMLYINIDVLWLWVCAGDHVSACWLMSAMAYVMTGASVSPYLCCWPWPSPYVVTSPRPAQMGVTRPQSSGHWWRLLRGYRVDGAVASSVGVRIGNGKVRTLHTSSKWRIVSLVMAVKCNTVSSDLQTRAHRRRRWQLLLHHF